MFRRLKITLSKRTSLLVGVGLIIAIVGSIVGEQLVKYPAINDISSDRQQAPAFLTSPPENGAYDAAALSAPTEKAYADVVNLHLQASPEDAFTLVQHLVSLRGWTVAAVDLPGGRIQAVATTSLLRFKDDVVVEVRPLEGAAGQSVVAMRSKSRLGKGDLGANAKRIRAFFGDLQAALP